MNNSLPSRTRRRAPGPLRPASEYQEHVALFLWRDLVVGQEPRLQWLYHCPNGGERPHRLNAKGERYSPEGQRLKAMGTHPGVLDLHLPLPVTGYHGWWGELKARGEQPTAAQQRWLDDMQRLGYATCVGTTWFVIALELCVYLDRGDLARVLEAR